MAPVPVNPLRESTTAADGTADVDPTIEIERLRTLLEKQPSCLMRIGSDGKLLAVNEAALSLLGGRALVEVLGGMLTDRIHGDGKAWSDFARRVSQAGSASTECEMSDLAGVRRAVIMQGVALPGHPDGVDSLLVAVRDVSTARRLQASLQEQEDLRRLAQASLHEATASVRDLRLQLDDVAAERDRLRAALDATPAEHQELTAALNQLKSALNGAIDATLLAQQIIARGGRT